MQDESIRSSRNSMHSICRVPSFTGFFRFFSRSAQFIRNMIVVKDEPRKFTITCVRHAAKCMLSPGDNFARFYRVSVRERLPSLLSLFPRYKFLWCRALIHRLAVDYGARSSGARYKEHISETDAGKRLRRLS